jgi:hypothetical protein
MRQNKAEDCKINTHSTLEFMTVIYIKLKKNKHFIKGKLALCMDLVKAQIVGSK